MGAGGNALQTSDTPLTSTTVGPLGSGAYNFRVAQVDAAGEPLRRAISAKPFVVKPNRDELGRTLDADTSTDAGLRDAMRRIVAAGMPVGIHSGGELGLSLAAKSGIGVQQAVEVLRTGGAGNFYVDRMVEGIDQRGRLDRQGERGGQRQHGVPEADLDDVNRRLGADLLADGRFFAGI